MRDLRIRDLNLGTMKSAKSAQLIMKGFLLDQQGKKVLTFKPEMDSRDGDYVVSRALPIKRPAIIVPTHNNGTLMSSLVWSKKPDVILIDELQFFTVEQVEKLAEISITYDVDIYSYGLMMSYNGKMFEPIRRAIECAFTIKNIEMACDHCINEATHHLRYVNDVLVIDGEPVAVEDEEFKERDERYESVCFSCYHSAIDVAEMKAIEASNNIIGETDIAGEGLMFPKVNWKYEGGIDISNSDV
jgi:thymidine kinase